MKSSPKQNISERVCGRLGNGPPKIRRPYPKKPVNIDLIWQKGPWGQNKWRVWSWGVFPGSSRGTLRGITRVLCREGDWTPEAAATRRRKQDVVLQGLEAEEGTGSRGKRGWPLQKLGKSLRKLGKSGTWVLPGASRGGAALTTPGFRPSETDYLRKVNVWERVRVVWGNWY